MKSIVIQKIKSAPKKPGVYIFRGGKGRGVLYVGKAANLRARLTSYLKIIDLKTEALHREANRLDLIPLRSEIEALIEESKLIKELKPKYNILWNDDKSYHYVYFTKEVFPKVFLGHANPKKVMGLFARIGPYTDGTALRLVMKLLRRQFPYCTCLRQGYGKASLSAYSHLRDCLNAQIGRCLGFCCKKSYPVTTKQHSNILQNVGMLLPNDKKKEYAKNIQKIKIVLRGQSKKLLKTLTDEKERWALKRIFEHRPYLQGDPSALGLRMTSVRHSERSEESLKRVECYDISHFAGKEAVGAMTVLVKKDGIWQPDKNSYRKFKIKSAPKSDDPRAIAEVLERRLNHPEWPYPDLIIIDGGITQYNAAKKVLDKRGLKKPRLTAFPKPQHKLIGWEDAPEEILKLAERAIHQTHNFVIRYHRQIRNKEFLL